MNIIAVDIGNTNIGMGLFLDGQEQFIESIPGDKPEVLRKRLKEAWQEIPVIESSREGRRDGVIVVSSVKPAWTDAIKEMAATELDEDVLVIGKDIPLPLSCWVDEPEKLGTDRVVLAAAAYDVVEGPVIVIDLGTALTIDVVDENGVFRGGVICPGFAISAKALSENTAQLPVVEVVRPQSPYGRNTGQAINNGLYFSMVATIQEVIRRFAEELGHWPQTVITGAGARTIQPDCEFIDSYVPNLVVKGIVLAYQKHLEKRAQDV